MNTLTTDAVPPARGLRARWYAPGGYSEVLRIAFPLIISTGTWSIQHFVDRMFLAWYSPEAIAAAVPAGLLSFTITCLFMGTASYVGTFVAQYYGAGKYSRCGPSLWQGMYVALIGGILQIMLIPLSEPMFRAIGHAPALMEQERIYFEIMCWGAGPVIASSALVAFLAGLGHVKPVMWINIFTTAVHLVLDWILIFGHLGFPEMGIAGAGIAMVIAFAAGLIASLLFVGRSTYARTYHTISGWRFERELFSRLVRYGVPSGIQFFIDIAGFTAFVILIGRLGTTALAATNIAFNINTLAFMPMMGTGIAVSVLVGQRMGENRPALAEYTTCSAFHLTCLYMFTIAFFYVVTPGIFIEPFASQSDPAAFAPIRHDTVVLLRFVALYSLFDTMNIVFASAIKGAGDTFFVMVLQVTLAVVVMIVPSYAAIEYFSMGLYGAWIFATVYIILLGVAFFIRFRKGAWKSMRIIEERRFVVPPTFPEAPTGE